MASPSLPTDAPVPDVSREKFPSPRAIRSRASSDIPRRDVLSIAIATLIFYLVATLTDLNEALGEWSRPWEAYQLDELPVVLLFLVTALVWFGWRRHKETRIELERSRTLERGLEQALTENRRLVRNNLRLQEEERRLLARELHDEMGQSLNAIKVEAFNAQRGQAAGLAAALDSIIEQADRLHVLVRDRLRSLRPPGLDELGLDAAIEECVAGWQAKLPGVAIRLRLEGGLDDLGEAANIAAFRLVQEGLTNAARHAHAGRIDIRLGRHGPPYHELSVEIADDGIGLPAAAAQPGLGLAGMRERVAALGGTLDIGSGRTGGVTLRARFPLEARPMDAGP